MQEFSSQSGLQLPFRLILASASPRRKQLLEGLGLKFEVRPVEADESKWPEDLKAEQIPIYLARHKAESYSYPIGDSDLLITSDTVVWCENKVLNKPLNEEDALRMLTELSGKMHEVFTAVCLRSKEKQKLFYDCTKVYFKKLSSEELLYYIRHYKPFDKAGAYGAQDWIGLVGVERIEGSYFNVMGLPVHKLYEELKNF